MPARAVDAGCCGNCPMSLWSMLTLETCRALSTDDARNRSPDVLEEDGGFQAGVK